MCATSGGADRGLTGTKMPPSLAVANSAYTNPGVLTPITAHRSPAARPASASTEATRLTVASSSA
jgi:hypothetical protein